MFKIKEVIDYINEIKKITKERGLKYYINTFGCQLNENDSEKIAGMLVECGYQQAEEYAKAGIIEELTEKMGRENN